MSGSMATLTIVGALAKDPEMRYTPSGQAVTSFSIPVNRKYANSSGEEVKETTWYRISTWGKRAEICNQYLKKGSLVGVSGRLLPDKKTGGPRVYQKNDGSYGAGFDVQADDVRFLHTQQAASPGYDNATGFEEQASPTPQEDDIPF